MTVLEFLRSHALSLPTLAKFAIAMAVIFSVPWLSLRVRLPPVVGLLLSGVVLGPHGLALIGENRPVADFFPIFFIVTVFLIDPIAFAYSIIDNFPLVLGVIGALYRTLRTRSVASTSW